jgi:CheY-like chemotaxis protein
MTRVLVADDQALLRGTFRLLIDSDPELVTVGEAENGAEAVERARAERPARSRRMSATCSASSPCATGHSLWCWRTKAA